MNVRRAFFQASSIAIAVGVTGWVACSTKSRDGNAPGTTAISETRSGAGTGQKQRPKPLPAKNAQARRGGLIAPGLRGGENATADPGKSKAAAPKEARGPVVLPSTKAFVMPSTKAMVMPKDVGTAPPKKLDLDAGPAAPPVRFMPPTKSGRLPKFFNRKDANPEPQRAQPQRAQPQQNAAPQQAK